MDFYAVKTAGVVSYILYILQSSIALDCSVIYTSSGLFVTCSLKFTKLACYSKHLYVCYQHYAFVF